MDIRSTLLKFWAILLLLFSSANLQAQELLMGINAGLAYSKGHFVPGYAPVKSSIKTIHSFDFSKGFSLMMNHGNNGFSVGFQSSNVTFGVEPTKVDTYYQGLDTIVNYLGSLRYGVIGNELSVGYIRYLPISPNLRIEMSASIAAIHYPHISNAGMSDNPHSDTLPSLPRNHVIGLDDHVWKFTFIPGIGMTYHNGNSFLGIQLKYRFRQSLIDSRGVNSKVDPSDFEYTRYGYYGDALVISLNYAYRIYKPRESTDGISSP